MQEGEGKQVHNGKVDRANAEYLPAKAGEFADEKSRSRRPGLQVSESVTNQ